MLAAAQSPPPPPPQRHFGPAHRHLALLRTADWRQSAATPLPHANGEAENKEPRDRGCVREFLSHSKPDFFNQHRLDVGRILEESAKESQTGALRTTASSLSISASSLLLLCLCASTNTPGSPIPTLPSD